MRSSTVLLKPYMSLIISYNPSDCWKYFNPQHIFILCSVQISMKNFQSIYYSTYSSRCSIFESIMCELPASSEDCCQTRISSYVYCRNYSIQNLINSNCFIRENYIEKKVGVIVSFFQYDTLYLRLGPTLK